MHLNFVISVILVSYCMPVYGQDGEDYSACFQRNVEIPGVNESTAFSFAADRQVGAVCTADSDCSDEFTCVPTTADPPVDAENLAPMPAFCQAPADAQNMNDLAVFIPFKCRCIMDLVYVIDKSGSMGTLRFAYQIKFLQDLTNQLAAIDQNKYCIKYGITTFNHAATNHLGLTYSTATVLSVLNSILTAGSSGGSSVNLGMLQGNTLFGTFGDRSYAPNVMLVTTDLIYGSGTFLTNIQAASLTVRNTGTCIHAVGINTNPTPSMVVLQAITGNLALVTYSLEHLLSDILDTVQNKLCGKCRPCICPNGYTEYEGRCYIEVGPACWFYGQALCHKYGAKFTSNWAAAITVGGSDVWFNHPNNPLQVNWMPFCTTTSQSVACCEERGIVCERPCVSQYPTQDQLAELAGISPTGTDGEIDTGTGLGNGNGKAK